MTIPTLLGTGGHLSYGQTYTSGTYYSNVGLGRCAMIINGFTTESFVNQTIRVPGTISYLSWGLDTAFGATLTLSLRKNSLSSNLAVSIDSSTTGWVTDSTDSVAVVDGDALDFATHIGIGTGSSYSGSFYCVSARFDAITASAQMLVTVGPSTITPSSTQRFVNFFGILSAGLLTEIDQQFKCSAAGTWRNMACYIETNTFTGNTTVNSRINNGNGSSSLIIGAETSGSFEIDASSNDSVSVGDLLDYGFNGSGSGNFIMSWLGAHFLATDTDLCMIGGAEGDMMPITHAESPLYSPLFGGGSIGGGTGPDPVPRATGLFPYALTASNFTNHLTAATQSPHAGAATFTLQKNGSPTSHAVSSLPGATGYFTDNTATAFAVGDTTANNVVVTTTDTASSVTWASAALLLEAS